MHNMHLQPGSLLAQSRRLAGPGWALAGCGSGTDKAARLITPGSILTCLISFRRLSARLLPPALAGLFWLSTYPHNPQAGAQPWLQPEATTMQPADEPPPQAA